VVSTTQCNPGGSGCKSSSSAYDKLGDATSTAYPVNNFTVTYGYDAAARLTSASDSNGVTYAQTPTFLASGAIQEFSSPNFNNNKFHADYNSRLQPTEIWAGPSAGANALFDKKYSYNAPSTSQMNNGNVYTATNMKDDSRTQSFTYDSLNRLLSAGDKTHWSNTYVYDAWGNLYQKNPGSPAGENLQKVADINNRLSGISYDAAGNVTNDGTGNAFLYDAENRIISATNNGTITTYTYDAFGRRIKKASGTTATYYWFGPGGDTLSETDASGNFTHYVFFAGQRLARNVPQPSPNPADIKYYITDHLHSTAMFVDKAGTQSAILDDNDFYPWGGVVPGVGTTSSNNHYKFTGKERDTESQLDYFGARYYANITGRFMSPDWAAKPTSVPYAEFGDPQSLNLYSYVRNSPIVRVDADGHNYAGMNGLDRDTSAGLPMADTDDMDVEQNPGYNVYGSGNANSGSQQQQQPATQSQDNGGFGQKLGNLLTGNGWKTDAQVTAAQRKWLTDHKVQGVDANGNTVSPDWSKANATQVKEAYKYMQRVVSAADTNHSLAVLGIAATITFGHGARHLEGTKLTQSEVESAIRDSVQQTVKNATQPTTNFWGRVTVNGQTIEYRAFTLPNGTTNVGTYYIPIP